MERRHRRHTAGTIGVFALCGLFVFPSPAGAQAGWTGRITELPGVGANTEPDLAVDAAGNALAVWCTSIDGQQVVQGAAYIAAQDIWNLIARLFPSASPCRAQVGLAGNGDAVIVWSTVSGGLVHVAHYSAATGSWGNPIEVESNGFDAQLAVSPAGHAALAWVRHAPWASVSILAAAYQPATRMWTAPVTLAESGQAPRVCVDALGNATAVWSRDAVHAARYSATANVWADPVQISAAGEADSHPRMAVDGVGNVAVVWARRSSDRLVRAARFAIATEAWSPAVDLSVIPASYGPRVASSVDGKFLAGWAREGWDYGAEVIQVSEYTTDTGSWSPAVDVPSFGAGAPSIALDAAGNAVAAWPIIEGFQVSRGIDARQWQTVTLAEPPGRSVSSSVVRIDDTGNAIVVWAERRDVNTSVIRSTRWAATPVSPRIAAITSGDTTLDIEVVPPASPEPFFAVTNYEYSLDDGRTWITRAPASATPRIVVTEVANGVAHALRVRAVNISGPGARSDQASVTAGLGTPVEFRVIALEGTAITLGWSRSVTNIAPSSYILEGRWRPVKSWRVGRYPARQPSSRSTRQPACSMRACAALRVPRPACPRTRSGSPSTSRDRPPHQKDFSPSLTDPT